MASTTVDAVVEDVAFRTGLERPLVAFVAKMMSLRAGQLVHGGQAPLPVEAADAITRYLSERLHPSTHTVKMQSAFEGTYAQAQSALDLKRRAHARQLSHLGDGIAHAVVVVEGIGVDIGRVAAVHTAISSYVHTFLEAEPSVAGYPQDVVPSYGTITLTQDVVGEMGPTAAGPSAGEVAAATVADPRDTSYAPAHGTRAAPPGGFPSLSMTATAAGGLGATAASGGAATTVRGAGVQASGGPAAAGAAPGAVVPRPTPDPVAAREVQAALESVLPKAAMCTFLELPGPDRIAQLDDAAHIVLGMRVFNWSLGRGAGRAVVDVPGRTASRAGEALRDAERALASAAETAQEYTDVLLALNAGLLPVAPGPFPVAAALPGALRPAAAASDSASAAGASKPGGIVIPFSSSSTQVPLITPAQADAWPCELANRRQLVSCLASIAEEARGHGTAVTEAGRTVSNELAALKELITGKSVVSKELVYPHFAALARAWLAAAQVRDALEVTLASLAALKPFVAGGLLCTLPAAVARAARVKLAALPTPVVSTIPRPPHPGAAGALAPGSEKPVRLSLDRSPDFLQLPLEYQGYCPVAMATTVLPSLAGQADLHSLGLLVAGDPYLGVIRWRGRHYVAASEAAVTAFMGAPEYYTRRVQELARARHWELVHLAQLFGAPGADTRDSLLADVSLPLLHKTAGDVTAVARALGYLKDSAGTSTEEGGGSGGEGGAAAPAAPAPRYSKRGVLLADAGVETPVHFVDKHIDRSYTWNEWDLRRKALQILTLQNCRTTSSQTDASHFRRDNDAQVYLPRDGSTQTGISTGTNTVREVRYLAGLRGVPEATVHALAAKRGIPLPAPASASEAAAGADPGAAAGVVGVTKAFVVKATLDA